MSLYLGNQKITPIIYRENEDPDDRTEDLPVVTEWTRPTGWPNLDAITMPSDFEGVYLTYDNTSRVDFKWACFRCVMNTGTFRVEQGHLEDDEFIIDEQWDVNSGDYKEVYYGDYGDDYIIFRVKPTSTNHINQFYFARVARATLGTYANRNCQDQYCLERIGQLPYMLTEGGSGTDYRYCTFWLEHDKVSFGDVVTTLAAAWYQAYHLQKIEFNGWTGENCNINSLGSTFQDCQILEQLDLSSWVTDNWTVTSLSMTFYRNYKLRYLNVPWNTSNWVNTTLYYTWVYCYSLERLDLSSWDTSKWDVGSMRGTWGYCNVLKKLNIKDWDTSNWHVDTLYLTWGYCTELIEIDLSNWDTENWIVTSLAYVFQSNYKRRNFDDIKNWKTSNWRPSSMAQAFGGCYRVLEIDLSKWDVSEWPCTSLYQTWNNCIAMRSLKVGTWDMTKEGKWQVTTISYIFSNCYSLEDTTFFNWHPKNWVITQAAYAFINCFKIKEIDLTKWEDATWNLTNNTGAIINFLSYCHEAKKIDISPLNLSNITTLSNYGNGTTTSIPYECQNLEQLILPSTYKGYLNLRYNPHLTRTELVRIFNALPTALANTTIVLTELRYKLTTADIAIATNKGYTVS